jgi:hypothetical protein
MWNNSMAFSDLKFGWNNFVFELRNIELINHIDLQENDEEYGWVKRDVIFLDSIDPDYPENTPERVLRFEGHKDLRYSGRKGRIAATAVPQTDFPSDDLFLGVPENRESLTGAEDSRLDSIEVKIHMLSEGDIERNPHPNFYNRIGYTSGSEYHNACAYMQIYLPSDAYSRLEEMIVSSTSKLQLDLNIKCWHWNGPIGDNHLYIPEKKSEDENFRYKVEIGSIVTVRSIADGGIPNEGALSGIGGDSGDERQTDLMFGHMLRVTKSLRGVLWVIAISIIVFGLGVI